MECCQKKPEIVFLRIDGKRGFVYNKFVCKKTLMTDGLVEHHTE